MRGDVSSQYEQRTNEFRFLVVEGQEQVTPAAPKLQQKWIIEEPRGFREEWRDVPLVVE